MPYGYDGVMVSNIVLEQEIDHLMFKFDFARSTKVEMLFRVDYDFRSKRVDHDEVEIDTCTDDQTL